MFSPKLKQAEKLLNNFLNEDYNDLSCSISTLEYNGFDALKVSFDKSEDVILLVDSEDEFIDVSVFSNEDLKDNSYVNGYGIPYEDVKDISSFIKNDLDNIVSDISLNSREF